MVGSADPVPRRKTPKMGQAIIEGCNDQIKAQKMLWNLTALLTTAGLVLGLDLLVYLQPRLVNGVLRWICGQRQIHILRSRLFIMGIELATTCVKEEDIDFPAVPPGFESFTSFKLKRVENNENEISYTVHPNLSEKSMNMKIESARDDSGKISSSLRRRPWINYGRFDNSSDDESDSEWPDQKFSVRPCLPKGVIRGCSECQNCQKVIARWHPEAACRPNLEEVPVFYPNEKEFQDPIKYITMIRPEAEPYGICRIVPPPSWKPPCRLKEKCLWESSRFATRIQRVDKLQNRVPTRKLLKIRNHMRKKRRRCSRMGVDCGPDSATMLDLGEAGFGFEPGPEFTLDAFQRYADDFKAQYFRRIDNNQYSGSDFTKIPEKLEPSIEAIEGEYWRIVKKPTEEIEVLYGADLETGVFGSGFPKVSGQGCSSEEEHYGKSGWNLNNLSRLPGSVLSYESADISGVQVPWLYIGMCFSSFCWHVEDHHLYSLNYMHFGAPKMWYGVPGSDAIKLEEAMRKHLPELFEEQPDLLHKLVTQLSPALLKSEGVPVYRCIQNPGEFVLTFPRAYHSGFNCGFNCAEAVNVAPLDWFPHGQNAVELYREQGRKTTISHDKLLLGAAREAVKANWELNLLRKNTTDNLKLKDICGRDGILAKSLKARIEMERVRREFLCRSSKSLKMESSFDATNERECSICFYDLHLSAAGCRCSPDKFACLNHAKQLCSCGWGEKYFLFRYDIAELNLLIEAVEGKLSAVYRWARLDLGLALSSYISKGNMHATGLIGILSQHPEELFLDETTFENEESTAEISTNPTLNVCNVSPVEEWKRSKAGVTVKDTQAPSGDLTHEIKPVRNNFQFKKYGNELLASASSAPPHLKLTQKGAVCKQISTSGKPEAKFSYGQVDVICLSDDEGEQLDKPLSDADKLATFPDCPKVSDKVVASDKILNHSNKDLTINAALTGNGNLNLLHSKGNISSPKDETDARCELRSMSSQQNISCHQGSTCASINENIQDSSNIESCNQNIACAPSGRLTSETKFVEEVGTIPGSPSCSQNNLDRYYRQKGPRIAKVVRRINCNVEPLEFGVVMSGKLWSRSQAIFPKGFKSRVRYIDISNPTNICFYVSEILDGGPKGPLFMVTLEHCPNEVFVHVSPSRCWEMVRERVNEEITKQHKHGIMKLPPLQPPGSLDGLEMFGFTSPSIIRGIEALDKSHISKEYWNCRPMAQISQCFQSKDDSPNEEEADAARKPPIVGVEMVLGGLLKKANPEELHSLLETVHKEMPAANHSRLIWLLKEEIHNRSR
ncbi:hypothetical protein Nepgr_001415 [Nepenthes gracilis]|uniref:Lysine-specific demethylase JMJ16 n=1 Tax=Nepenthes gracilis TaxID=150966 RepID=A0AAD3P4F3_NEPGR|nr:hypothetical protein Nepgr_001415 [Nepenthes gracilis]